MNDYTLLQIKEKNFIDEFKLKLKNMNRTHTQMETNIYIYIGKKKSQDTHSHREKITTSEIRNDSYVRTHTTYQMLKVNEE